MKPVLYLLCGVPGSGKTWVCRQLSNKMTYVPHDDYIKSGLLPALMRAAALALPVLTECPFGERELREELERRGFDVRPVFIVEKPDVVAARYFNREKRPLAQASITRATSIKRRAEEWQAPYGTSADILALLEREA